MRDDILIMPVFHQEPARYSPKTHKSQLLIKPHDLPGQQFCLIFLSEQTCTLSAKIQGTAPVSPDAVPRITAYFA